MKTKFLSVAMAAVMGLVCLTGCSGNFTKNAFINAAKKNGMKELDGDRTLNEIMRDQEESDSVYYIENDQRLMQIEIRDYAPDAEVKVLVKAVETIGKSDDHKSCLTLVYFITFEDSENAKKTYKQLIKRYEDPENGEKDGVTYSINYLGPDDRPNPDGKITGDIAYGVYLKDDTIIWIRSSYDSALENDCVEDFCKSLGLVSPYTPKEN